jgi:N-hydroxyarylamine O-acetyltransferase
MRHCSKVVGARGFCYELNGLFASLLRELGYDVVKLSARVANDQASLDQTDHMTLLVTAPKHLKHAGW